MQICLAPFGRDSVIPPMGQRKCINKDCKRKVSNQHYWCTLECKKAFYNQQYLNSAITAECEAEFKERVDSFKKTETFQSFMKRANQIGYVEALQELDRNGI